MAFSGPIDKQLNHEVEGMLKRFPDGLLPIVSLGEPVLRAEWQEYTGQLSSKTLAKLIKAMRKTMLEAPGVGLAAPQIGLPLAFAVVEDHVVDLSDLDAQDYQSDSSLNADSSSATGSDADEAFDAEDYDEDYDEDYEDEDYDGEELDMLTPQNDPREVAEFPFHVIINPVYKPIGEKTASFYEGCLSMPGYQAVRKRWLDIEATWYDEKGMKHSENLHGWPARIFQHETDHLSGEVYIDKAETRSLATDENLGELWWDPRLMDEARATLGF